jgi:carbamoyl-phosphate synthase large subunit
MKVLFTSVGRRVELIQAFRQAANELNIELTIIGTDIAPDAPALCFCDETQIVCRIKDKNYIPQLLAFCESNEVDCIIPTIDTDLLLLAENKKLFEKIGTKVLISAADKVRLCRDKNYTAEYFISLGLKSPLPVNKVEKFEQIMERGEVSFPAFIKPKDGSSSINAYRADNLEDLKLYADKIGDYIIQPYISGREYTIDIFCDYEGNPVYITPRERLAVRAGEVLKTRITQDDTMISEMLKLVADYKPCGQITVQLIREEKTGDNYYIEINPRFGGGAPLSIKAGANSAKAVLKMLNGEKLLYLEKAARDGAVYSRFDQSICINEGQTSD